jgi:hypothetical protein
MAKYLARENAARLELVDRCHRSVVTMATRVANAAKLLRNSRASNIGAIRIC